VEYPISTTERENILKESLGLSQRDICRSANQEWSLLVGEGKGRENRRIAPGKRLEKSSRMACRWTDPTHPEVAPTGGKESECAKRGGKRRCTPLSRKGRGWKDNTVARRTSGCCDLIDDESTRYVKTRRRVSSTEERWGAPFARRSLSTSAVKQR